MKLIAGFIVALSLGMLRPLPTADAQQLGRIPRVGVLSPSADSFLSALRQGLRELGYIEGRNISLEYRSAEGRAESLPELAAELVRLKVDVIVTLLRRVFAPRNRPPVQSPLSWGLLTMLLSRDSLLAWPGRAGISPERPH